MGESLHVGDYRALCSQLFNTLTPTQLISLKFIYIYIYMKFNYLMDSNYIDSLGPLFNRGRCRYAQGVIIPHG
jgi:hypothetical protein